MRRRGGHVRFVPGTDMGAIAAGSLTATLLPALASCSQGRMLSPEAENISVPYVDLMALRRRGR